MTVIRLTKEFTFEAAHALDGYDGPCREIHGHSYRLFVTVKGIPLADAGHPKQGMVMDFGLLKRIVSEEIIARFDHALVLQRTAATDELRATLAQRFDNLVEVDYRPTCENMLADFATRIRPRLPQGVSLHALRLHETATSFAEWFAEDNFN
ncbi:MAG: 6-carboxytetrahydropterin synthase [Alistipes senegalensis]|nr:6-carboxytetrahydropterin synthase [Bacteroides cellulosilyticus]MCM1351814.1 6-carboxytetrahydropterin synthase [Alistipes senegalensis]